MPIHDEDLRQEKLEEMREDYQIEQKLRADWDFVLEYYGINENTTIGELQSITSSIQSLDWEIDITNLMEEI